VPNTVPLDDWMESSVPVKNHQDCPDAGNLLNDESRALGAGFTADESSRLARLRRQVRLGQRSDSFPVDRRQDFVRWLIDHGMLSDN
jgi:hypothetical protein